MKKLTLLIALFLCIYHAHSQSPPPDIQVEDTINITRDRFRDTCFGLIDKTSTNIPSGYLIDYSLADVNSASWDGVGTNDTIKTSREFFYYHNVLELAAVNGNAGLQITDNLYITAMRYRRDTAGIPLLFLYQPYQKIDPNALANNLLAVTSDSVRLLDVTGRASSPYLNKELFVFSAVETSITQFGYVLFTLPAALWEMPGITTVTIDFGDGVGPRIISKGSTATVNYSTEGYKTLTATITVGGNTRTAYSRVLYKRPNYYIDADTSWSFTVTPLFIDDDDYLANTRTGHRTTDLCTNQSVFQQVNCDRNPGAHIRIVNGCDGIFDRPIIIIEGFDTDNTLTLDDLADRFSSNSFTENMRAQGFDFVYVDLTKSSDYIENNAKVLEQVITDVNNLKVGTARGTVIGYSVGGIIARWCLKDMEDRNIDHGMAHYFSYDSPHQGANIPLGLQYIFQEMEHDFSYIKWFNSEFRQLAEAASSPAARQVMVTKAEYTVFDWMPNPYTLHLLRARFAQRLVQKGYPANVTRHAISIGRGNNSANTRDAGNGTQFGNFGPGDKLFDGNISWVLINLWASAYAVRENNTNDYIARYRFVGYKAIKIFGVTVGTLPSVKTRNFKYTGQYPYDDAPGSFEVTQTQFRDRFNSFRGLGSPASNEGHLGHCFIPLVSALDLQNQSYSSTTRWQSANLYFNIDANILNPNTITGNNLSTTGLSPFNFVLTNSSDCNGCASTNVYHNDAITSFAAVFMERKIRNAAVGSTCNSVFCNAAATITGPTLVCADEATYQLNVGAIGITNINWQIVNGTAVIISGQGTPTMTLSPTGIGNEIVRVTLTNACGQTRLIDLSVQMGLFTPTFDTYAPSGYCTGNSYQVSAIPNNPTPVTYNWWVNGVLSSNHNFKLVGNFPNNNTRIELQVVKSGCFSAKYRVDYLCGSFRVSPNPAANEMTVTAEGQIREIRIVDQLGTVRKTFRFTGKPRLAKIPVSDLEPGLYTVRIFDGTSWTSKLISVLR